MDCPEASRRGLAIAAWSSGIWSRGKSVFNAAKCEPGGAKGDGPGNQGPSTKEASG